MADDWAVPQNAIVAGQPAAGQSSGNDWNVPQQQQQQSTPQQSQAQTSTEPDESMPDAVPMGEPGQRGPTEAMGALGGIAKNIAIGGVKSAVKTGTGLIGDTIDSDVAAHHMISPETDKLRAAKKWAHSLPQEQGARAAQQLGGAAETGVEALAGGKVVSSLTDSLLGSELLGNAASLSEKLGVTTKLMKLAEDYPMVGHALRIGLSALKGGTEAGVTMGTQEAVRTGDIKKGAKVGLEAGAVGAGLGLVGGAAGALIKPAEAAAPVTEAGEAAVADTGKEFSQASKAVAPISDVDPSVEAGKAFQEDVGKPIKGKSRLEKEAGAEVGAATDEAKLLQGFTLDKSEGSDFYKSLDDVRSKLNEKLQTPGLRKLHGDTPKLINDFIDDLAPKAPKPSDPAFTSITDPDEALKAYTDAMDAYKAKSQLTGQQIQTIRDGISEEINSAQAQMNKKSTNYDPTAKSRYRAFLDLKEALDENTYQKISSEQGPDAAQRLIDARKRMAEVGVGRREGFGKTLLTEKDPAKIVPKILSKATTEPMLTEAIKDVKPETLEALKIAVPQKILDNVSGTKIGYFEKTSGKRVPNYEEAVNTLDGDSAKYKSLLGREGFETLRNDWMKEAVKQKRLSLAGKIVKGAGKAAAWGAGVGEMLGGGLK
jgi:hypothetical protein